MIKVDFEMLYDKINYIAKKNRNDEKDLLFLLEYLHNEDAEIRAFIAELLVRFDSEKAKSALMELCEDDDEMVRVNACDSLAVFRDIKVYHTLLKCYREDGCILVKNYALLSIIDIMKFIDIDENILKEVFLNCLKDSNDLMRASAFKGLYLLNEEWRLDELLDLLYAESHELKCSIINILFDIITKDNKNEILEKVFCIMKNESSKSVLSAMEKLQDKGMALSIT